MITSNNYNLIPNELKQLPQWVCCNDTQTKLPLNPFTLKVASIDNPKTWGTYEQCLARNTKHIGFVFTKHDPYAVIDLDDKPDNPATEEQRKRFSEIINYFDSYTEISQSGFGVHVICKGPIFRGVRKEKVELYTRDRYVILTGNVLGNPKPINEREFYLNSLFRDISRQEYATTPLVWLPPSIPDSDILAMGERAVNGSGAKFKAYWKGDLSGGSQSEADYGLLSLLCFYSQSNEQVIRLFRQSALGQREKAYRQDYIENSLLKIRASLKKPDVDFSQLDTNIKIAKTVTKGIEWPPGFVGEIAKYIYKTSKRPVKEISIAAAIALVSGIVQRAYNISNTGLNQYIILIADTGRGKEDAGYGVERIMQACRDKFGLNSNIVDEFMGPASFESRQSIGRLLTKKPCFLSVLGEFGKTLARMTGPRADPNAKGILEALLNVYNKSGHSRTLRGSVYSDSDKNVADVRSPAITILGEGSTSSFYSSLDQENIADGLIPRFLVLEYDGIRVPLNDSEDFAVPDEIVNKLCLLINQCFKHSKDLNTCFVGRCPQAAKLLKQYDNACDKKINDSENSVEKELFNRAHFKALKLSAMLAVADNYMFPNVEVNHAQYAIELVEHTSNSLIGKFVTGEVGTGNERQDFDFKKCFDGYSNLKPRDRIHNYHIAKMLAEYDNVVPFTYLRKNLRLRVSFKNDKDGAARALENTIQRYLKEHILIQVSDEQAFTTFATKSRLFMKGEQWNSL